MGSPLSLPLALPPAPAEHHEIKVSDVAYTTPAMARAHAEYLGRRYCLGSSPLTMWEPFAGAGAYLDAWEKVRPWDTVVAGELDPGAPSVVSRRVPRADVFDGPPCERVDWIVTNPPFSIFDRLLPVLLDHAEVGVSLLLVGQSLAPSARRSMWESAAPDDFCWLTPRLGFDRPGRGASTSCDMREYALVTWFRRAGAWRGRMRLARLNWQTGDTWGR